MRNARSLQARSLAKALVAAAILTALLAGAAAGNPLPEAAMFIHVHSWDPGFCDDNPITECAQLIQYSEIDGEVEFDLFLANPYQMVSPFSNLAMTVEWPEAWHYVSFESCSGGMVTEMPGSRQAHVEIQYFSPLDPGALTLLGRFRLQVSGFGALGFNQILVDGNYFYGPAGPAQAGVDCTYSFLRCSDLQYPCGASIEPDLLELQVPEGGTTTGTMQARATPDGWLPCQVQFQEDADWMDVSAAWDPDYGTAELTVTVDASGMVAGVYEARLRAVSETVYCAAVRMTVTPVASVPGPERQVRPASWGAVKSAYR